MLARFRARLIHGTQIPVEQNAAPLVPFKNHSFIFRFRRIGTEKLAPSHTQKLRQPVYIALIQWRSGHTAAVRAHSAVNGILHILRNRLQLPLDEIMPLQPSPKFQVFVALSFAKPLYLHEVGQHPIYYRKNSIVPKC